MLRVQPIKSITRCSAAKYSHSSPSSKRHRRNRRNELHLQRGLLDHATKDIQICETVENMSLEDHTSPFHAEGCQHELVTVTLDSKRCSGGHFIKGNVSVKLQFCCERCSAVFEHPINESFEIWANHKIKSWDDCIDADEVPFPPSVGHLDITESVAMAIDQGFPRYPFCGQSACVSTAESGVGGTEWSGWSTPPIPHSNVFSCLKDFKDTLDDSVSSKESTAS